MIGFLRTLSSVGVTAGLPEREAARIGFLNVLILANLSTSILFLLLLASHLPATWPTLIVGILYFACTCFTLLWNYSCRYLAARIWLTTTDLLFNALQTALLGAEARFHILLVIGILIIFYRFSEGQRGWTYSFVGLYGATYIALEVLFRHGGLIGGLPREIVMLVYSFNTVALLLCAVGLGALSYIALSNTVHDREMARGKSQQLEMADKYKSHFLASASHDLRQPLHALNLFVAQLKGETEQTERKRLIAHIDAAVGSMNDLFEALLDMTKLDAGILKPDRTKFCIDRLLRRVETTFADAARKKGLRLRIVACNACVLSDPILLQRILLNLVSNAVRYTERGGVAVGCRRRGGQLRIDVYDTGAGIPEDQHQSIFGEFYQLAAPDAASREGLGLGLAIVDRLGQLLGHPVELDSRPGRGSRFSVVVPLVAERGEPETVTPSLAIADPAPGKRVIVIDDDTLVLDGMRGILQSWGCQVQTVTSGATALACLAVDDRQPDLIISDSRLADGDTGIEAIEQVREALGVRVPALIITGDTAPERLREASAAGFHLLHKPIAPAALRATVNHLLRHQEDLQRRP